MKKIALAVFVVIIMIFHMIPVHAAALIGSTEKLDAPLIEAKSTTILLTTEDRYFKFIPTEDKFYTISTSGSLNAWGYLQDANGNYTVYKFDENKRDFELIYPLIAGQTYYLMLRDNTMQFDCTLNITGGGLFVPDTTPPAEPVILSISDDTGVYSNDRITNDNTLIFSGMAEAGSYVEIYDANTLSKWGSSQTDSVGNWRISAINNNFLSGDYNVVAKAKDLADNESEFSSTFTFKIDKDVPNISALSPMDNASDVGINDDLVISFSENVYVGTGNIGIYQKSDNVLLESIPVTDSKVTGSGTSIITINPASTLESETQYYVQVDATAFTDVAGNTYAGIADQTSWDFTAETVEHLVTFVDHDGAPLKEEMVEDGYAATAPTNLTREGHTFVGWDTDFSNVTEDLTVTAQWELTAVQRVINSILGLPDADDVKLMDGEEIKLANRLYNDLSESEKQEIPSDLVSSLNLVVTTFTELNMVDNTSGLSIKASDGTVLDPSLELVVEAVDEASDHNLIIEQTFGDKKLLQVFDISLMLDGQKVQLSGTIRVSIPIPTELLDGFENHQIVYISEDGTATVIPSTIEGNMIWFETDHFSDYGIIADAVSSDTGTDTDAETDTDKESIPKTGETTVPLGLGFFILSTGIILLVILLKIRRKIVKGES